MSRQSAAHSPFVSFCAASDILIVYAARVALFWKHAKVNSVPAIRIRDANRQPRRGTGQYVLCWMIRDDAFG
jgi:hypothetical protein